MATGQVVDLQTHGIIELSRLSPRNHKHKWTGLHYGAFFNNECFHGHDLPVQSLYESEVTGAR